MQKLHVAEGLKYQPHQGIEYHNVDFCFEVEQVVWV